jgi:hypothetical protein
MPTRRRPNSRLFQAETDSQTDCSNTTSASVGAGPLATTPTTPVTVLSRPELSTGVAAGFSLDRS